MDSKIEYILCVGDSLTFGARDEYYRSYPAELSRIFWEKEKRIVYAINEGISGETSSELLRRIYASSRSCPQAKVALLWIGTNDTWLPQRLDIYKDNLRQIITVLRDGREAAGVGLLPSVVGPGLPIYPRDSQQQVDKFNEIITEVASEYGCFIADFRDLGKYIIDTVHFGHEGYEKVAEIWYEALKKEKIC